MDSFNYKEREVSVMYQIYALLGLMVMTWGACIYSSMAEPTTTVGTV
jgi:hypothetical protein